MIKYPRSNIVSYIHINVVRSIFISFSKIIWGIMGTLIVTEMKFDFYFLEVQFLLPLKSNLDFPSGK